MKSYDALYWCLKIIRKRLFNRVLLHSLSMKKNYRNQVCVSVAIKPERCPFPGAVLKVHSNLLWVICIYYPIRSCMPFVLRGRLQL